MGSLALTAISSSSPVVWTMSALIITLIIDLVYFCIFFMMFGAIASLIIIFYRPLIKIIRYGY